MGGWVLCQHIPAPKGPTVYPVTSFLLLMSFSFGLKMAT
jgi:hypothetical protein